MVDGEIIAGPHVRDACARHLSDLEDGEERGLRWTVSDAEWAIRFFPEVLRLNGGKYEGQPFRLLGWEAFIVGALFGWQVHDEEHGWVRRFRVAYVETAKGSGKSPLAAGVGIKMLVADNEARAEVYAAATKKDQAMILFRDAVAMVDQSPSLSKRLGKTGGSRPYRIYHDESGSFFESIASDDSQSGPRPHCALLDEIHEHKDGTMVDMMRAGTKSRRQALIFMITNSGVDRTSVCFDHHQYGAKVAAGEVENDAYFAYICAVDEGEDPLKDEPDEELGFPASWAKANPSLVEGNLPGVKYLTEQVREAKGMPAKESIVRRLNFCQWVDAANPWIDGYLWRDCEVEDADAPEGDLYAALDLSGKLDLTALAVASPDGEGGFDAFVRFWSPAETLLDREATDRVPYKVWQTEGHLETPPGRSVDYADPAGAVAELYATGRLKALAFDPYRMDDFARELDRLGVPYRMWEGPDSPAPGDGVLLVRHGQGYGGGNSDKSLWMPRSIGVLEDAVLDGNLRVRKNPVLTWNSASAVIETDAQGNKKWEKRKSTGRIDGIVALSMAVGAADVLENTAPSRGKWLL